MKKRLAAAALAAALTLPITAPPANAQMVFLEIASPQQMIDNAIRQAQAAINGALAQAQAFSSQFIPGAPAPAPVQMSGEQRALLDATNRYRTRHGLRPLQPMGQLNNVAQGWAQHMANTGHYGHRPNFNHHYPPGYRGAAENIAAGHHSYSANEIVDAWGRSPGHRANMLNPGMTHIGVGVAYGRNGQKYAVQNFARY